MELPRNVDEYFAAFDPALPSAAASASDLALFDPDAILDDDDDDDVVFGKDGSRTDVDSLVPSLDPDLDLTEFLSSSPLLLRRDEDGDRIDAMINNNNDNHASNDGDSDYSSNDSADGQPSSSSMFHSDSPPASVTTVAASTDEQPPYVSFVDSEFLNGSFDGVGSLSESGTSGMGFSGESEVVTSPSLPYFSGISEVGLNALSSDAVLRPGLFASHPAQLLQQQQQLQQRQQPLSVVNPDVLISAMRQCDLPLDSNVNSDMKLEPFSPRQFAHSDPSIIPTVVPPPIVEVLPSAVAAPVISTKGDTSSKGECHRFPRSDFKVTVRR